MPESLPRPPAGRTLGALALAVLLAAACRPASPPASPAPGETDPDREAATAADGAADSQGTATAESIDELVLRFDKLVTHDGSTFRLLAIDDSRCPIGVQCVWEGQVTASIEVRSGASDSGGASNPETVKLTLPGDRIVAGGRQLRLVRAEPHPREGVTPARAARFVTLEISPL